MERALKTLGRWQSAMTWQSGSRRHRLGEAQGPSSCTGTSPARGLASNHLLPPTSTCTPSSFSPGERACWDWQGPAGV